MSKNESKPATSLFAALVRDRAIGAGGLGVYAEVLDVGSATVSRLASGKTDEKLRGTASVERVAIDLELTVEELRILGGISVPQACEIVLQEINEEPEEIEIRERFIGLMEQRGKPMPPEAFTAFLRGNLALRRTMVRLLEENGDDAFELWAG